MGHQHFRAINEGGGLDATRAALRQAGAGALGTAIVVLACRHPDAVVVYAFLLSHLLDVLEGKGDGGERSAFLCRGQGGAGASATGSLVLPAARELLLREDVARDPALRHSAHAFPADGTRESVDDAVVEAVARLMSQEGLREVEVGRLAKPGTALALYTEVRRREGQARVAREALVVQLLNAALNGGGGSWRSRESTGRVVG